MVAILVPLNEWSAQPYGFLESLTHRATYNGIQERDFVAAAARGSLALVLDAWNELDPASRNRAATEISRLRRELPLLQVIISTRRQVIDVPLAGPTIEIQPLSEEQQVEIAGVIRGDEGERLVDAACREAGLRELVSIPLYLTALLQTSHDGLPESKEMVLSLFIEAHEKRNAAAFRDGFYGLHEGVLRSLAVEATVAANTAISDSKSRAIVAGAEECLRLAGQITEQPQPAAVLDLLVNHHTLVRTGGSGGVAFQHQQIQEWYASLEVADLMWAASDGAVEAHVKLRAAILNEPVWEEAILFTCDRLSRASQDGVEAVAHTIVDVLGIDPLLSAEMIRRSSDDTWDQIKEEAISFVKKWHIPGRVDRAVKFMIDTGRSEFSEFVWPLISDANNQVHLKALRAGRGFRPSVLGADAEERIAALPKEVRKNVISEIASEGGMDGIELATSLAKADASAEVQKSVVESLLFRRADRFAKEILELAPDEVWKSLARTWHSREIVDPEISARIQEEADKLIFEETDPERILSTILSTNVRDPEAVSTAEQN